MSSMLHALRKTIIYMFLQGKKVTLRALEEEDLEFVRSLINDPDIERTIVRWNWLKPKKDQEQWFMKYSNSEQVVRYQAMTMKAEYRRKVAIRIHSERNSLIRKNGLTALR